MCLLLFLSLNVLMSQRHIRDLLDELQSCYSFHLLEVCNPQISKVQTNPESGLCYHSIQPKAQILDRCSGQSHYLQDVCAFDTRYQSVCLQQLCYACKINYIAIAEQHEY